MFPIILRHRIIRYPNGKLALQWRGDMIEVCNSFAPNIVCNSVYDASREHEKINKNHLLCGSNSVSGLGRKIN